MDVYKIILLQFCFVIVLLLLYSIIVSIIIIIAVIIVLIVVISSILLSSLLSSWLWFIFIFVVNEIIIIVIVVIILTLLSIKFQLWTFHIFLSMDICSTHPLPSLPPTMEIKSHSFFVLSLPSHLIYCIIFYFTLQFSFWL